MKADFEKGTKICCRCKKELPLDMFYKDKSRNDGLCCCCKKCSNEYSKAYSSSDRGRKYKKVYCDKRSNTFGRVGCKRGHNGVLKRDYELSKEQLNRRNVSRKRLRCDAKPIRHGVLIWYSGELEELSSDEYKKAMNKEYTRQRYCAIRGYIARVNPYEHFLFDFDLEEMFKDKVYYSVRGGRRYITKWWKGEIRHWTVKDDIWKE